MASFTSTETTDDLSGEVLDGEVTPTRFSLQGQNYVADFGPESLAQLVKALAPFAAVAQEDRPHRQIRGANPDSKNARAWALANGTMTATRGAIPADVLAAWREAGSPAE